MAPSLQNLRRLMSSMVGSSTPERRRARRAAPILEGLEGRVVLSRFGGADLAGASRPAAQMGQMGQASTSGTAGGLITGDGAGTCGDRAGGVQDAQLAADRLKLQTDLNAALAGSSVTDAQRLALKTDLRAIATAGVTLDKAALATVADRLLTSIAAGTYDADQAAIQSAFTASFSGTSGASLTTEQTALVSKAYADFVAVARGLNLDSTELGTLATDRAAIQSDLDRLGITADVGQPSNLDLILSPGLGIGRGRGRRGRR